MQRIVLVLAACGALTARLPAQSDSMVDGTWHGWLQQADQDSIRVSYNISHSGHHLLITMRGRSGINYDMADAKVKQDVLTFDWDLGLGSILFCRLSRRDGKDFEGICNDRSPGESGAPVRVWMLMTPPDTTGR